MRLRVNKTKLLRLALFCILAVSAIMLAVTLLGYARDRRGYASAREKALSTPAPTLAATLAPAPEPAAPPTPEPLETPPIAVDFEAVRETGMHVRGWLYSADTVINYPVVYYSNNSYYLEHDYTGRRSGAGALFFDTRATKALTGDNLIIYGHHMKDRSMFGSLLQYQKQEYYDAHPTMYLLTLDGNFRIDLIAARFQNSDAEHYPIWFESDDARRRFVQNAVQNSDFQAADYAYRADARIVSLVTCAYSSYIEDAKYAVTGWLTPIG